MNTPNLTYISILELEAFLPTGALDNLSELEKMLIIYNAEQGIDKIVGNCWHKVETTQIRVFPTVEHGLPDNIKFACLYYSKELLEKSSDDVEILEEKHGTSTYKYGNKKSNGNLEQVKLLLKDFICSNWLR